MMFYFFTNAIYCVIPNVLIEGRSSLSRDVGSNFLVLFCNSENLDRKLSSPVGTYIVTVEGET